MKEQIKNKIVEVLKELDLTAPNEDHITLTELGVNSFDTVRIITILEEEFDIEFDIDEMDISNFKTIENIIDSIASKLGGKVLV